jgi:DNA-binding SARP family transcriptional activator
MIELQTLGRGTVRRDGEDLSGITSQKQRFALLVYLAVEKRASRGHLLALFWPEREEEKARHSLSQAIYALKRELGEECLRVESDSVEAASEACDVDATALQEAAEAERWEAVTQLYRGPFLDQFQLPGAPEFEKWQSSTRTRLARLARRAFRHVVEQHVNEGDLSAALTTASHWAALDPLEDEAHHTCIALLARSGQRSAALEHYEAYRSRLASELDVEPLDETVQLVARIRAGAVVEVSPFAAAKRPSAAPELAEPPATVAAPPDRPAEPAPAKTGWAGLMAEFREHRVFHVGAFYLAVAWLAIQFTGTLVEHEILPNAVFRFVLFLLAFGLPFALILAWAHELKPEGTLGERAARRRPWPQWAERVRGVQVLWFLGALFVALLAASQLLRTFIRFGELDRSRVVVFPLHVTPEGNEATGEHVATWVQVAIEAAGLRWVDGWYGLDALQRAGLQPVARQSARAHAHELGAAYYVQGRIVLGADSALVRLDLYDVAGDSVVASGSTSGPLASDWERVLAYRAMREPLRVLAPGEPPIQLATTSPSSQAAAQFQEGDRAYRRAQFAAAFQHYRGAVEVDSSFSYAALRGAQAALWVQEFSEADRLLDLALRQPAFMPLHRAELARGLEQYVAGAADSAVAHLQRAIASAPESWDAWARLGEVYYHLMPAESPLDSLAEAAFLQVYRRDPGYSPVVFHLIQIAVRKGELARAEDLMQRFRTADPDSARLAVAELMLACVTDSPELVDWRSAALDRPNLVLAAGDALAVAGGQTECARAAWSAVLTHDTATDAWAEARLFDASLSLQSLLAAEGRTEGLVGFLESDTAIAFYAGDFYLLDADAGTDVGAPASTYAEQMWERQRDGSAAAFEIWLLGLWETSRGRAAALDTLARSLAQIAEQTGDRSFSLMARSLEARATLVDGDTAAAIELLAALRPDKRRADSWYPWETLAGEQLFLAEALYERGDYGEAVRIAANIDAPAQPPSTLMYLPRSLVVRVRAAQKLGDRELERRSRVRLTALGRSDLLAEPSN